MRATTDSKPGVDMEEPGAGVRNLLNIFQAFSGWSDDRVGQHFSGMRYGDLKKTVAEAVVAALEPIQKTYREIVADPRYVEGVLRSAAERVSVIADDTVVKVKRAMGLYV